MRVESEHTEQAVRAESMRAARLVLESEQAREDSEISATINELRSCERVHL